MVGRECDVPCTSQARIEGPDRAEAEIDPGLAILFEHGVVRSAGRHGRIPVPKLDPGGGSREVSTDDLPHPGTGSLELLTRDRSKVPPGDRAIRDHVRATECRTALGQRIVGHVRTAHH